MDIKKKVGLVFNIQHFAVHDGPGIRTLVFLKGCPLKCWWCSNPEGQNCDIEIGHVNLKCKKCLQCMHVCPNQAINFIDGNFTAERSKCDLCGKCIEECNSGALKLFGKKMNAYEILNEIKMDEPFYKNSGGGVTFSGGEPLNQADFLESLLELCKNEGINTAIETSGFCQREALLKVSKYTDLFLFDIKHVNERKHRKSTGVSSIPILENFKHLVHLNTKINVRIPLIPGFNMNDEDISQIMSFLNDTIDKKESIHLLPFHKLGMPKYDQIGKMNILRETKNIQKIEVDEVIKIVKKFGFKAIVGGTE